MNGCGRCAAAMLVMVLALSGGTAAQDKAPEKRKWSAGELKKLVQDGDKLMKEGKLLEARPYYYTVLKEQPANAEAAAKLAAICEQGKDWQCVIEFDPVVTANAPAPEQLKAHIRLATAYARTGKYAESVESARKAVALDAAAAPAQVALAFGLVRTGAAKDALPIARKAVELAPASAQAHAALGEALLSDAGPASAAEAEAALRKAVELDASLGEAHAALADVLYKKGDHDAALASAQKAIALNAKLTRAYAVRGKVAHRKGDASAYSDLGMAMTTIQDDPELYLALAQLQRKQASADVAITSYRKALSLNPNFNEAYLELGELLIGKGDLAGAREPLQQAATRMPTSAQPHLLLGRIHEKQNEVDLALAEYGKAVELDPKLADLHYARGKILREQKKDNANALIALEKAAALKPDDPAVLTDLGTVLYDLKQPDRALEVLQKAAASPDYKNPMGFAVLGLTLKDKKRYEEALGFFDKAVALAEKWWLPHWGAAWSYFGLLKKGCPCGPEDAARVQKMKVHYDRMVALDGKDPALDTRVAAMVGGKKIM